MPDLELLEGVAQVPRDEWNALVGDASPFLEWDWLASLEQTGCVGDERGWGSRPLVVRHEGRLLAACPLYVKTHSEGEFVFDWGWADAAERAGLRYYPKLLVGVPFTPVSGARFLVAPGEDREAWIRKLGDALVELCRGNDMSGVHVNFCRRDEAERLADAGYELRVGVQYHWQNAGYGSFDDYLERFRSKRRNQIRRERREVEKAGVRIEVHSGDAIDDALFEPMYRFYCATVDARHWGRRYLNRELFERLSDGFRERLCFVVAWQGDRPIAGTTNVRKGDALYGRYWGSEQFVRHLHFEVCYYAAVEHCIEQGLARFEPGAGGEYKQLRGFDAQPTYSAHWLADPRLREAVRRFLHGERAHVEEAVEWMRGESALKPAGS